MVCCLFKSVVTQLTVEYEASGDYCGDSSEWDASGIRLKDIDYECFSHNYSSPTAVTSIASSDQDQKFRQLPCR